MKELTGKGRRQQRYFKVKALKVSAEVVSIILGVDEVSVYSWWLQLTSV